MTTHVESLIDQLVTQRPLRPVFIVPGTNTTSAALDLARSIARRAEHNLVAYQIHAGTEHSVNPQARNYLNRVSDLLYVLARCAVGEEEEPVSHEALGRS